MIDTLRLIFTSELCVYKVALRAKMISHAAPLRGRLLDAGCGHRPYLKLLPCDVYIGLETSEKNHPDVVGSVLQLPFASESFDSSICLEVIEHLPEPSRALAELWRVLRPGGHLYVTTPQMWYNHYEPHDFYRYTNHGLRYLLEQHGFEVLSMKRVGGLWRFLFARGTETSYRFLRILLFPLALHNAFRNAFCRVLCAPLNLLGLVLVPILDQFSKRDHLGWVALVRKREN